VRADLIRESCRIEGRDQSKAWMGVRVGGLRERNEYREG
jgi:hypothetical protein